MSTNSRIEWTQNTWNPVTGCTKISSGCKNCYSERMAKRLQAMELPRYRNGFQVTLHEDILALPFTWKQPRVIFVNSMSDLFHEKVPDSFIHKVFDTMIKCPQHTFQILTKRSKRLVKLSRSLPWANNIWMGVSVEDDQVVYRVSDLQKTPSSIRFISYEPLIGPINSLSLDGIHWVIVGGESGPGARQMNIDWVISIQKQCESADVPFFFKQWGGTRKKSAGRILNGKTYSDMPATTTLDLPR
jgi:protein gp37